MNDRADELFAQAREFPESEERAAFLAQACGGDADLLQTRPRPNPTSPAWTRWLKTTP